MSDLRLQIIVASTRPGRVGIVVADWFEEVARSHGGFEVTVTDLAEVDLPLLDEPNHPRSRQYVHDHTKAWSRTVERADAFVIVMPEYNHGYNGALKNALDFLFHEWRHKPVGFVSYGGLAAGTRAVQSLKPVLLALSMVPVTAAVAIPFFPQFLRRGDGAGRTFVPDEGLEAGATAMLDVLVRWAPVGRQLRVPGEERHG